MCIIKTILSVNFSWHTSHEYNLIPSKKKLYKGGIPLVEPGYFRVVIRIHYVDIFLHWNLNFSFAKCN